MVIETERLILRGWRDDDADAFHAMGNDPRVMEFLGPPLSRADVDDAIARQNAFLASTGSCFWAVERRADGAFLGFCGVKPGPADSPVADLPEIGWRLAVDYWGKGYAREAAVASLAHTWSIAPGRTVWAITVAANHRSWGLMERLGMVRRPDYDFDYPGLAADDPLRATITYSIDRPATPR